MNRINSLAAALLFGACFGGGGGGEVDTEPIPGAWTAEVAAIGETGHSGFGTISITAEGQTRANVTLSGGSAGGDHPWGIHEGTCEEEGALVGDQDAYPNLQPNDLGNASATATLPLILAEDESYSLKIYHSAEDLDTIVGCGELSWSG